ncbi:hypothetical protein BJF79_13715 [Actinomadura sp. CNU-125]|nr:hypothetical protein BJF79_13715 [Actinomadura sp. CNU-125]
MDRFLWERLLMMSDLPQGDRFKLLALGIFMDGTTGDGARPGNANLAMLGFHEETWKQLLRRAVKAGWLILRERGGSRKGPGGVRVRRASRYAASVPAGVWARREEVLGSAPFRSSKEAPGETVGLPSKDAASTKEASDASFEEPSTPEVPATPPVEGSPEVLRSTSTKEASETYEGSISEVRRKSPETSPSILPSSHRPSSQIGSDPSRALRDDVQDRRGARWLEATWPGVDESVAADVLAGVRAEAARYGREIGDMVGYLKSMHRRGDLTDFVGAALDRAAGLKEVLASKEASSNEAPQDVTPLPPPARAVLASSTDAPDRSAGSQMAMLHAVPDEPGPTAANVDERGLPAADARAAAHAALKEIQTRYRNRAPRTRGTGT